MGLYCYVNLSSDFSTFFYENIERGKFSFDYRRFILSWENLIIYFNRYLIIGKLKIKFFFFCVVWNWIELLMYNISNWIYILKQ